MQAKFANTRRGAWQRERRGTAMIFAVVAVAVAATMMFYLLKNTLDQQRQMLTHRLDIQADALAAAGIDRAVAQLNAAPDYTGETWNIPAAELNGADPAEVIIKVAATDEPSARQITVQADYPADTPHRSRKTRHRRWP